MKRTSVADLPCSVARTLEVVGEWWTLLVLRDVFYGRRRFEDIAESLPIARNILSDRLGKLVDHGILRKVPYQERPLREEYRLTEPGRDLFGVLMALMAWGDRWLTDEGEPCPLDLVHVSCGEEATAQVVCTACGEELRARDVRLRPNLGQEVPEAARA